MKNIFGSACLAVLVAVTSSMTVACSGATDDGATDDSSEGVASKSAHFEQFVGQDGQHYFSLVAANGQNVLRSEGYNTTQSASKGIASVQALLINVVFRCTYGHSIGMRHEGIFL